MKKRLMYTILVLIPVLMQAEIYENSIAYLEKLKAEKAAQEQPTTEDLTPSAPTLEEIQSVLPESSNETENLTSSAPIDKETKGPQDTQIPGDHFNDPIDVAEISIIYPGEVTGIPARVLDVKGSQNSANTEPDDGFHNIAPKTTHEIQGVTEVENGMPLFEEKIYEANSISQSNQSKNKVNQTVQSKVAKKTKAKKTAAKRKSLQKRRAAKRKAAQKKRIAQKKAAQQKAKQKKAAQKSNLKKKKQS